MELLEVLEGTSALLKRSGHWCKGATARDRGGRPTRWHSPTATSRCVEGAFRYCAGDMHKALFPQFAKLITGRIGRHKTIFDWNDDPSTKHRDVVLLLEDVTDLVRYAD